MFLEFVEFLAFLVFVVFKILQAPDEQFKIPITLFKHLLMNS